ncbi:MAG: hypothetical protein NC110_00210 [Ruminococcus sp.]|nr:hypothetical protein [Ruminococcus sp.]MCM1296209.1 hypothetical protein [Muribaculaceae bacterium]MCM1543699.1 hypothetical protein [Ruminococcus sp.]
MTPTPPKEILDFIKKHRPGMMPLQPSPFSVMPSRPVQRDFNIETAFDRHTVFRISYLPFVFFDVIWDYIDTLNDLAKILKVRETRHCSRALNELWRDYDRTRSRILDYDHRKNIADHAEQFIEESPTLQWAWNVIHSEYRRKNPDLLPDWVMFIAQADLVCSMFAALIRYARHFDDMITKKAGRKLHSILPDEIYKMQKIIPEYMGGMKPTRIRRLVDAALFRDFLTQELTDDE